MTPKRKVITKLNLTEISGVPRGAVEGAIVRIVKSADGSAGTQRHKLTNIKLDELSIVPSGANQFSRIAIAKAEEPAAPIFKGNAAATDRIAAAMLAAMKSETIAKSQEKEVPKMSDSEYDKLLRDRVNKSGGTLSEAHTWYTVNEPETLAKAYAADEGHGQLVDVNKAVTDSLLRENGRILKPSEIVLNYAQAHGCTQEQAFLAVRDTATYKRAYDYFESTVPQVSSY